MARVDARIERISARQALPLRQTVLRPGHPLSESCFSGDEGPEAGHFAVVGCGEKILAVGTVYPEPCSEEDAQSKGGHADAAMRGPRAWRLRGMATDPACRSLGYGSQVLEACLDHARRAGAQTIWCNARVGAVDFYLRHGFKKMSAQYEMPGIGPHFLMKRDL